MNEWVNYLYTVQNVYCMSQYNLEVTLSGSCLLKIVILFVKISCQFIYLCEQNSADTRLAKFSSFSLCSSQSDL